MDRVHITKIKIDGLTLRVGKYNNQYVITIKSLYKLLDIEYTKHSNILNIEHLSNHIPIGVFDKPRGIECKDKNNKQRRVYNIMYIQTLNKLQHITLGERRVSTKKMNKIIKKIRGGVDKRNHDTLYNIM